jgi:hypothetical protein
MAFGGVALEPAGLALGLASGSELGDEAGLLQLGEGACNLAVGDLHRVVGVGEVIARRGQRAHAEFDQGNDAEFLGNQIAGEAAGVLFTRVGLATFWRRRVANAPHGERHPVIVAQGCDLLRAVDTGADCRLSSRENFRWYLTAVLSKLSHDLPVQPPVHGRGLVHIAGIMQFLGKLLASGESAVEVQEFHQVHN